MINILEILEENDFSFIKNLSQKDMESLETNLFHALPFFSAVEKEENVRREKQLIEFIEKVGLFKDLTEERALDFAKKVVTSNSIRLMKWLFSRGLSPDTKVDNRWHNRWHYSLNAVNDKWPLASFIRTIDMLNVFISHGANLALTSENGVQLSKILFNRTNNWKDSFATTKDRNQIISTVYKAEAATQVNPQEHLWELIKEAKFDSNIVVVIQSCKDVCDLRDEKGRHIVQFAMLHNPTCVNAILSVNKKTLTLGSTPDEYGRSPSIYWIASEKAQSIKKTNQTTVIIPNQIDEKMWRQAAELVFELKLSWIGLCSYKVQQKFEKTTGKKLDEWIEEEAANGSQWFERMLDLAAKFDVSFQSSDVIKFWADPDNNRVVNKTHALFRAHLILATFMAKSQYTYPFYINPKQKFETQIKNQIEQTQKVEYFLKAHLFGKIFDTFKNQINNGISFMSNDNCKKLTESQWWKETCAVMERRGLLNKHTEVLNAQTSKHKFNAL